MIKREHTLADAIFDHVVGDILSGRLRPKDKITERDLVTRFGASRTPAREAIKRLRERGFLTVGGKGVAIIREMSREEVEELYALRLWLERAAAVLTVRNIGTGEIARLKSINRQFAKAVAARDLVAMLDVRAQFHALLAAATRNRWLADMLITLRDYAYPIRHVHWQEIDRAARTIGLHEDMIESLERRDAKRFCRLVVSQIREGLDVFRNRLTPPADSGLVAPSILRRASGSRRARAKRRKVG